MEVKVTEIFELLGLTFQCIGSLFGKIIDAIKIRLQEIAIGQERFRGIGPLESTNQHGGESQLGTSSECSSHETINPQRFRVALSFRGELRKFVEEVASYLAQSIGQESVFYDM